VIKMKEQSIENYTVDITRENGSLKSINLKIRDGEDEKHRLK